MEIQFYLGDKSGTAKSECQGCDFSKWIETPQGSDYMVCGLDVEYTKEKDTSGWIYPSEICPVLKEGSGLYQFSFKKIS